MADVSCPSCRWSFFVTGNARWAGCPDCSPLLTPAARTSTTTRAGVGVVTVAATVALVILLATIAGAVLR